MFVDLKERSMLWVILMYLIFNLIGTIMGYLNNGTLEITNCYGVNYEFVDGEIVEYGKDAYL